MIKVASDGFEKSKVYYFVHRMKGVVFIELKMYVGFPV